MTRLFSRIPRFLCTFLLTGLVFALGTACAHAQHGLRNSTSVSGTSPPLVTLTGTVTNIEEGSCGQTTGRSPSGTHLLLQTENGPVDLHLGPTTALGKLRDAVTSGIKVAAKGFRTKAFPNGAYAAVRVTVGEEAYLLRDPATLRPRWSTEQARPRVGAGRRSHWCPRWRSNGSHGGHRRGHHLPHHRPHH